MEVSEEVPPARQSAAGRTQLPAADREIQPDDETVRLFLGLVLDIDLQGHES